MSQAGKKIGIFNVLSEIGSGGMAVVYKAEQPSLGRLVAVKELRRELATDPSIITRFEREAKSVAALAHQNIVHIYDFITRGDSMFIAMEYVEGIDLYDLMSKVDRLPPDIAAIIALQAARALEYAHYRGVVHRDFKPSNLMITKQGEIKLMDFGIARDEAFDDLTRPGTALGTPAYMSPEQILGERVDFRSDLFSFGIVLYQMVTGQKPFADDDTKSVLQRILNDPFEKPRRLYPDIPLKLQGIVRRCLEKRPDRRYKSTEALRRELEDFVAGKVRINYNGRLVIFLRNRNLISDSEAKTYVRDEELKSSVAFATDTGAIDARAVVIRPLLAFHFLLLLLLAGFTTAVETLQLGAERGYVRIHAVPWAEVFVDGDLYDTTPFAAPIPLPPGRHTLEFRNRFLGNRTEIVEVKGGETARVQVELRKQP
ncbi:MAG: protein kinase [Deltaproteobacteria bacterium]|nr:protein kinase [Deltaproteobacteria bacterium]